jgi:hypothetical protein
MRMLRLRRPIHLTVNIIRPPSGDGRWLCRLPLCVAVVGVSPSRSLRSRRLACGEVVRVLGLDVLEGFMGLAIVYRGVELGAGGFDGRLAEDV